MKAGKKAYYLLNDFILLTLACFIFAFAWESFMIPNGMSAGGFMGLCTVIQYATGGAIQAQYSYFVLNSVLIIVAVIAMGIGFGFKTIYCIVMSSVAMQIVASIPEIHSVAGQFLYVRETLLIPVIAGLFEAVGLGLVIRYGASTGGTDIVALMVNKYWPVSLSKVFLISDIIIVGLLLFLPDKAFTDMVYGLIEIITFSSIIDYVVGGDKSSYQLLVFSDHYSDIADHIITNMNRGVTVLDAQGWYTKKEKNVLLILISRKQLPALTKVIKEVDPRAFISVTSTSNVYGEGFEEIKTGLKKKNKSESNAS